MLGLVLIFVMGYSSNINVKTSTDSDNVLSTGTLAVMVLSARTSGNGTKYRDSSGNSTKC